MGSSIGCRDIGLALELGVHSLEVGRRDSASALRLGFYVGVLGCGFPFEFDKGGPSLRGSEVGRDAMRKYEGGIDKVESMSSVKRDVGVRN